MAEKREQRGIQGFAGGKSSAPVQWRVARCTGKKLESLTVEIGDYGFVDVESTTANTEIVKQVVNDVMKTTLSQPSWRN